LIKLEVLCKEEGRKPGGLVILSGGLDSGVLLGYLQSKDYEVMALSFDYGQRHKTELQYAKALCKHYEVSHEVISLPIGSLLKGSALTDASVTVPEGHYADETMKATIVPNRNAMFLSIAYSIALGNQMDFVAMGVHAGDHPIYPDCRPAFIDAFEHMEKVSCRGYLPESFVLSTPFITWSKADIVKLGSSLRVPFDLTWSCYKGKDYHCGKCGTCVERKEAFLLAEVDDLTAYSNEVRGQL
jgi:7-cyano-7-deazaguanine synthase